MADAADTVAVLAPPSVDVCESVGAQSAMPTCCPISDAITKEPPQCGGGGFERYAVEQFDQRNCPICLEGYTSENPAVVYGCGHAYHLQCAEGWRLQSGEDACCMCGADIHGQAAAAEPVVLNSAATPGRSPGKDETQAKPGTSCSPPSVVAAAAAAAASATRAILPSSQSLDGLVHIATSAANTNAPAADGSAATGQAPQRHRRHRRAARSTGVTSAGDDDEETPLTPGVDSPPPPRASRTHSRRSAATFLASTSPARGVRAAHANSADPDQSASPEQDGTAALLDGTDAWAFMRRLVCCCFPGTAPRRLPVVRPASPVDAEGRSHPRRHGVEGDSSRRGLRHPTGGRQLDDRDDDGFVMVPTPSQSDADDEFAYSVTDAQPRHPPHLLAHGWPQ